MRTMDDAIEYLVKAGIVTQDEAAGRMSTAITDLDMQEKPQSAAESGPADLTPGQQAEPRIVRAKPNEYSF